MERQIYISFANKNVKKSFIPQRADLKTISAFCFSQTQIFFYLFLFYFWDKKNIFPCYM